MKIALIVAMAENNVIGANNALPWHLPEDLKRFKAITLGHPMIMGRKTYDSIGKPLPGRKTIVVSRNKNWPAPDGVLLADSIDKAIKLAEQEAKRMAVEKIMIVGGDLVYKQTIDNSHVLYVTEVHTVVEGDAYFPSIDPDIWARDKKEEFAPQSAGSLGYSFVEYIRK